MDPVDNLVQASMTQHANKLASNRMPPVWAIFAMLFLGFDEFMAVLYSPVLALSLIIFLLFIRSLYIEMDVDNEMQKGALPGSVALAGKFVPSVRSVSSKTLDSVMEFFNQTKTEGTQPQPATSSQTDAIPNPYESSGLRRRIPAQDGIQQSQDRRSNTEKDLCSRK